MIWVKLKRLPGNNISLIIKDNGIGFTESFEPHNTKTLGLKLVNGLAKQLKGDIQIDHGDETEFKITFPAVE